MSAIKNGKFWLGDCLELMKQIPDGSVDMILCDLPYGTTSCKWDSVIPFDALWLHYNRVIKKNGAIILTAAQPFTTALISSQIDKFRYSWVWNKRAAANVMHAKRHPLKIHEDIVVFGESNIVYFPQMQTGLMRSKGGAKRKANGIYGVDRIEKTTMNDLYYPKTIIEFSNAERKSTNHPTQKPVALFEYLIKTYTNEGETVLDNCAGSGTTAIAAENTNRRWICIEKEPAYYYGAIARIVS